MSEGKEKDDEPGYATYKGFGYVSMFMGVPLFPLIALVGIGAFGGVILLLTVGAYGLLLPMFCGLAILALKIMCETENKAMERARWSFKAWRMRMRHGSINLIVSPNHKGSQHENVRAALKKIHRSQ